MGSRVGRGLGLLWWMQLASCSALYSFDGYRFERDGAPPPEDRDETPDTALLDAAPLDVMGADQAPPRDTGVEATVDAPTDRPGGCPGAGEMMCAGGCVNTLSDPRNCGGCGRACPVACSAGACVTVRAIAPGDSQSDTHGHTCALMSDQTVRCWGSNVYGELGDGTTTSRWVPTAVPGLAGVVQITVGGLHTCARRIDGEILCWGDNSFGAVGVARTIPTIIPRVVPGIVGALWVSAGTGHTCAVLSDGGVRCWGRNLFGECGVPGPGNVAIPTDVGGLPEVTEVAAGGDHSCARRANGTMYCWGLGESGQLGDRTTASRSTPAAVFGASAVHVSSGAEDSCSFSAAGQAVCWGVNRHGLGGNGGAGNNLVPTVATYRGSVNGTSVGSYHACFLGSVGLWCAGLNANGQLGNGTLQSSIHLIQVPASALGGAVQSVGCGYETTCAVIEGGSARCWGRNAQGQLGDGTTVSAMLPVSVVF